MTRLEILCQMHKQHGGTIHEFNNLYKKDFVSLTDDEFNQFVTEFYEHQLLDFKINSKMSFHAQAIQIHINNLIETYGPELVKTCVKLKFELSEDLKKVG